MQDAVFSSIQAFQQTFEQGLIRLLEQRSLGAFILVSANANFDQRVEAATADGIARLYLELSDAYIAALANGEPIQAVEEDLMVFLKLHAVGFEHIRHTETRQAGPWEVQFNQLRSFRPKRIANQVPHSLHMPFDDAGFHFNKPFMLKETFWSGELHGRHATLYYNKYPFTDFHGLLVPERESCLSQFLTEAHHFYLWETILELGRTLPGVGFGYNSLGAFASVNHLHFQMFIKAAGFPVMRGDWLHNGGQQPYPTSCARFDSAEYAWQYLSALHRQETPYNLLYLPGRLYAFPRKKQGTYAQPGWTSGFTWHELAGGIIAFNRADYAHLDADAIARELAALDL